MIFHTLSGGIEKPVAYASRMLTMSEQNYAKIQKEALGTVFWVQNFRQYLMSHKFQLITDHKPLVTIFYLNKDVLEMAASRLATIGNYSVSYDYEMKYQPSTLLGNADGLSCLPLQADESVEQDDFREIVCELEEHQLQSLPKQTSDIRI